MAPRTVTVDRSISRSDQITEIHIRKLVALKKYGSRAGRRPPVFSPIRVRIGETRVKRRNNYILRSRGEVTASVAARNRNFREQVAVERLSFSLHRHLVTKVHLHAFRFLPILKTILVAKYITNKLTK